MLRGGIVGFGRMGVVHYAILNTHPEVEVTSVCDTSSFMLGNLRRHSAVEVFEDAKELLASGKIDFVVVCTPPDSHAEIACDAARRGLHVFMEKPFTLTIADGEGAVKAFQGGKLVHQVGYFLRFNEVFTAVKRHLDSGLLGELLHYRNEMYGRTVTRPWTSSWRMKKSSGGGCLLEFASHCIDLADHLFGPPQQVRGSVMKKIHSRDVDDAVYSTMVYGSGLSGSLMVNWSDETYRRPYNRIEVQGTKGKIIADRQGFRLHLREASKAAGFARGWTTVDLPALAKPVRYELRGHEYTLQLDHFVARMAGTGAAPACGFADALRTDAIIEQIRADARWAS